MCAKKRFVLRLRCSNDDYSAPTSAQASSCGQLQSCNGTFQVKSFNEEGAERAEDADRFALAPPLYPPERTRRRRLQRTQVSADVTDCRWGAHVREKRVFDLRHCSDDYSVASAAEVSSGVQLQICGTLAKSSARRRAEDADRFVLVAPLCSPDAALRRRREIAQLSTDATECSSAAQRREKRVYFTFAPLQRRLLRADLSSGQFGELRWRFVGLCRRKRPSTRRLKTALCHPPASVARLSVLADVDCNVHK